MRGESISVRMESKTAFIPMIDCHLWIGGSVPRGYGVIYYKGAQRYAHRVAYELTNGEIPSGMFVCHKCDVPSCVNPDHLFVGTAKDNMEDMFRKGRNSKDVGAKRGDMNSVRKNPMIVTGENNGRAIRTNSDILEIRRLYSDGMTQVDIAKKFNTVQPTISAIVRRATWKHL